MKIVIINNANKQIVKMTVNMALNMHNLWNNVY